MSADTTSPEIPFRRVDVVSDTREWLEERRRSVGASEVAAVMGLSAWSTPLSVYLSKHGVDREFDELLGFVGHESEHIIHKWVEQYSGVNVKLEPAFMARSVRWPFLHASFDRVSYDPFTTWQFKTAHQYSGQQWDEGVPDDIRVQVQAEMAVAGTQRAAVVVWIGGREFRLFWEPRDDRFINNHMIPALETFWRGVVDLVAPNPSTVGELNTVLVEPGKSVEADETVLDAIERRAVLLSDVQSQQAEAEALKIAIGQWLGDADTITKNGHNLLTYRYQNGRTGFDQKLFRETYPDLYTEFVTQGAPFRVMRTIKPKETKP